MSDVKWGNREVKEIEVKPGKFGSYKVLKTMDNKGKDRTERVYDRSLQELITKPGAYKFGYQLGDSGFPEIVQIEALNGATTMQIHNQDQDIKNTAKTHPGSFVRDLDTNRSILVQVCIKSAAEVYQGHATGANGVIDLAEKFLKFAEKELAQKKEDIEEVPI